MGEFIEEWEIPKKITTICEGMKTIADRISAQKNTPIKKKRGGLNEVTDLRAQTALLLEKPVGQIQRLTTGWTASELRDTLKAANLFVKNPPACWWLIYKANKNKYGQNNKRTLQKTREKGRSNKQTKRQSILF